MESLEIVIVGAGIGGLCTALALQRLGHKVRIIEQAEELSEVGAGLSLSPNANAGLHHLGLQEGLAKIGHVPASFGIGHSRTGRILVNNTREMNYENAVGAPYYMVHRADLHKLLLDAVLSNDANCLRLGCEFSHFNESASDISAAAKDSLGKAHEFTGDALIGCDGIHSAVRATLHGAESPRFTGYIAWRGLVPLALIPESSLPLQPESGIFIAPGKSITRYLLGKRKMVNYVAVAQRTDWKIESWSVRSETGELLDEFADFHSSILDILAATPPDNCYKWAMFDRDPLDSWSKGRVSLAGDAAHPMLPFMGQGAVMAIEDAVVLARCFERSSTIAEAFVRYEHARRKRCTTVMLESRANIRRLQSHEPGSYNKQSHKNEQRLGLFDYDPATVPI